MSNIIKCENCGCEEIDIIHKYKGYYVCPKCGRDTERLYEIEHDKEIRAKAIDEFADRLSKYLNVESATKYGNKDAEQQRNSYDTLMKYEIADAIDDVAEQMKAGGIDG